MRIVSKIRIKEYMKVGTGLQGSSAGSKSSG